MAETQKPDLTYICPNCGQKAILGTHFCQTVPEVSATQSLKKVRVPSGNRWIYAVAVSFLVAVVLWRFIGPGSLVAAGLALVVFYFVDRSWNHRSR